MKCKLILQWDIFTHTLEALKLKRPKIPSAGVDIEQLKYRVLLMIMSNDIAT